MTAYVLQVILFQLLFLLVYEFLLKKETFFSYNRWYLLFTASLSFLLPLIKIEALGFIVPAESLTQISSILLPESFIGRGTEAESIEHLPAVIIESSRPAINLWIVIYLLGVITSLVILLKKYANLSRMFRFRKVASEGYVNIIEVPNSSIACTFYNTIFLGDKLNETEKQHILTHELVHLKQKHSLDLVFFEALKVFFWFNPLIYIYQNRIATVHEFIADAAVVQLTEKHSYYEQLLNSAFNTQNISFINQFFNHSLTRLTAFGKTFTFGRSGGQVKKRILMLQRSRSASGSKLKYLVMVPLMLVMLTYVACSDGDNRKDAEVSLSQYTYTMRMGEPEMDKQTKEIHKKYEAFLKSNQDHVSWAQMDREKGEVIYSVHHKDEKVPSEYSSHPVTSPDGSFYTSYFMPPLGSGSPAQKETTALDEVGIGFGEGVEEIPLFKDCEIDGSADEMKACMTKMIKNHVLGRFNTNLGKELGLEGRNHILTTFTIDKKGRVSQLHVRAPHPALEEEAKRVINSLPQMTPARNNGEVVEITYSLPITFQVNG